MLIQIIAMKNIVCTLSCFFCLFNLIAQNPDDKLVISNLYVYDLASHSSNLVTRELRHIEAPNWSRDGQFFLINAYGKLE